MDWYKTSANSQEEFDLPGTNVKKPSKESDPEYIRLKNLPPPSELKAEKFEEVGLGLSGTLGTKPPITDPNHLKVLERAPSLMEETADRCGDIKSFLQELKWTYDEDLYQQTDENTVVVIVAGQPLVLKFPRKPKTSSFNLMMYKQAKDAKKMYIMRGIPGSGKSTKAKELGKDGVVYAGDDFFMVGDKYMFDKDKLSEAHKWNMRRVEKAAQKGISPIVVDNTNLIPEDALPYAEIAVKYGYDIEIVEPNTPWKFDVDELTKRNTHGVPRESIERKLKRYTPYTVEDIFKAKPRKKD